MIEPRYFGPRSSPLQNAAVGRFVCELIWQKADAIRDYCTMGVFDKGALIGGTLYHNWCVDSGVIELTSASLSRRWLSRPVILAMFDLPFETLKCQMVALRVSENNQQMLKIASRFGFTMYRIPRLRGRNEDEFICTLTDTAWKNHRIHKAGPTCYKKRADLVLATPPQP